MFEGFQFHSSCQFEYLSGDTSICREYEGGTGPRSDGQRVSGDAMDQRLQIVARNRDNDLEIVNSSEIQHRIHILVLQGNNLEI